MKRQWIALALLLALLCGCGEQEAPKPAAPPAEKPAPAERRPEPVREPEPVPAPAEEPGPVPEPAEEPGPIPEPVPAPEPAEPHLEESPAGLRYIQADGSCLTDGGVGYLWFGPDGLYTCGDPELDAQVRALIETAVTDPAADSEARLWDLHVYIRDHFGYLGAVHYQAGTTDWVEEAARFILKNGKSNCYGFSALFCLCARQMGYQAYVVAGHEWKPDNEHAWVMIDWPDGNTYLFDAQLDCAYRYLYTDRPHVNTFKILGDGKVYDGHDYYFP